MSRPAIVRSAEARATRAAADRQDGFGSRCLFAFVVGTLGLFLMVTLRFGGVI